MTMPWLMLTVVAAIGVGVAAAFWRLLRLQDADGQPDVLRSARPALETYRPLGRLFAEEDFAFLAAQPGFRRGMPSRLRRDRRRVLRLYLREMRADFRRVYAICRRLAPYADSPDFAASITRQALSFYGLLAVIELRYAVGWLAPARTDATELAAALARLEMAARACLGTMRPQPVPVRV